MNIGRIYEPDSEHALSSDHVKVFTLRSLKQLLRIHNFKILEVKGSCAMLPENGKFKRFVEALDKVFTGVPGLSYRVIVESKKEERWERMKILLLYLPINNIGNWIINTGAEACLSRAFPDANVIKTSLLPDYLTTQSNFASITMWGDMLSQKGAAEWKTSFMRWKNISCNRKCSTEGISTMVIRRESGTISQYPIPQIFTQTTLGMS